ncbi:MAG: ABC transporter permease [Bacteroidetes bacterium]|nr:ABC transporter permease [Bacteroidota bacterium]
MLSNYLKITLAVMRRRKFFTFISLFGICMTLTILIVLTAFYEHMFGGKYPEVYRNRSLFSSMIEEIDTTTDATRRGPMSVYFIKQYISTLKTPEKVGFSSTPNTVNTYGNGKKLKLYFKYTDPVFWEILAFDFLEGQAITQQNFDRNEAVVVINDQTRDDYFGKDVSAVGKTIEINGQNLRVIGVVRGSPITRLMVSADVYMPYLLQKGDPTSTSFNGPFQAIVVAKSEQEVAAMQAEFDDVVRRIPLQQYGDFKPQVLKTSLLPYFESISMGGLLGAEEGKAQQRFFTIAILFALFFMSLPAINLVNINVSRILERSSEIGIRKSFGASAQTLVYQFVLENILITLIGGALALLISAGILWWFNNSHFIDYADLTINWTVVIITIVLSLVFGLMSGVLPAWRMSKLPIVEALRA